MRWTPCFVLGLGLYSSSQATFANAQQETRGVAIEGIGEIQRLGNEVERVASTGDRNAAFVGSGVPYGLKYARRLLDDDDEVDDSADSSWSEVGDSFAEVGNNIAGAFDQLGNELGDELKDVFSGRRSYARRLLDDDDRSDGEEVDDSADSSWSEVGDSFAQVGSDIKGAFNQLGDQLKDAFSGRRLLDADSVGFDEVEFDIAGGFNGAFDEFAELQNAIAGGRKLLDGESPIVGDLKEAEGDIQTAFNELGDELSKDVSGGRKLLHKNILKAIIHGLSPSHDQVIASQARAHQKFMDDAKRQSEEASHKFQEQNDEFMRRSEELAKPCMHSISPSFGGTQPPFPSHNDC